MKIMIAFGVALLCSTACVAQDRERGPGVGVEIGPGGGVEIGPGGVRVEPPLRPRPDEPRYLRQRCRTEITIDEDGRRTRRRICREG